MSKMRFKRKNYNISDNRRKNIITIYDNNFIKFTLSNKTPFIYESKDLVTLLEKDLTPFASLNLYITILSDIETQSEFGELTENELFVLFEKFTNSLPTIPIERSISNKNNVLIALISRIVNKLQDNNYDLSQFHNFLKTVDYINIPTPLKNAFLKDNLDSLTNKEAFNLLISISENHNYAYNYVFFENVLDKIYSELTDAEMERLISFKNFNIFKYFTKKGMDIKYNKNDIFYTERYKSKYLAENIFKKEDLSCFIHDSNKIFMKHKDVWLSAMETKYTRGENPFTIFPVPLFLAFMNKGYILDEGEYAEDQSEKIITYLSEYFDFLIDDIAKMYDYINILKEKETFNESIFRNKTVPIIKESFKKRYKNCKPENNTVENLGKSIMFFINLINKTNTQTYKGLIVAQ